MVKERASICEGFLNETSIMKLTINAETSKCTEKEKQKWKIDWMYIQIKNKTRIKMQRRGLRSSEGVSILAFSIERFIKIMKSI